jgi:Uma2 family endonuclease
MSTPTAFADRPTIIYPESDGQPMAENTLQFEWIVTLKGGVEAVVRDAPNVFVAGDLFWYPVEGDPSICMAPDVLVAFGRPRGHRGSYQQWLEDSIAPQVVFEVLSPSNRFRDMLAKFQFYQRYGVEEYYLWDPEHAVLDGWTRQGEVLRDIPSMNGWVSPRLGIRFQLAEGGLHIYGPDGRKFATYVELVEQRERERREKEEAQQQRDQAQQRAERLAAQLRALGANPEL